MSDVQSRPAVPRGGRSSAARGGRGGFASRGARNAPRSITSGDPKHDDHESDALNTLEDDEVTKELKKVHGAKLANIKAIFPDYPDIDILYALEEDNGDEQVVIDRLLSGAIPQWESSQKKDRSKAKAKDTFTTTTGSDVPARAPRAARPDAARGRGRATDRGGRGAARGRSSAPPTNGAPTKHTQPLSVPTDESSAWDTSKNNDDGGWSTAAAATAWVPATASESPPTAPLAAANPPEPAKSAVIPQGSAISWASMLRQSVVPKPAPPPPKEVFATQSEPVLEPLTAVADEIPVAPEPESESEPIAELSAEPSTEHTPADDAAAVAVPEVALPPSSDPLTKTNLEQVHDVSRPPGTDTVASEAADSWDPRATTAGSVIGTPISASQAQHQSSAHKAQVSGYAATAMKATERAPIPRVPTQQRRFLDQQEAVRMPGAVNSQLERATLQFGAFALNGTEEDIDGDREEPETRTQPPADSPVAQPRASLPPAPHPAPDAYPVQKPASSLTPGAAPTGTAYPPSHDDHYAFIRHGANAVHVGPQAPPTAPAAQQPVAQAAPSHIPTQPAAQQYGRFGQTASEQPGFSQAQKPPFDAYNQSSQPLAAHSHYDGFPGQQQAQVQPLAQSQAQQTTGPYSSATEQFSTYYQADPQSRAPYNNGYYGQNTYGQQQHVGQGHEGAHTSRAGFGGGYAGNQPDLSSQYPQSANQTRFGSGAHEQNSGPSTPVPAASQGPPTTQAHVGQQHGNQFYGQPAYYNQYNQGYGGYPSAYGSGYGTTFGQYNNKAGGGYQSQHYQQQQAYDHTSTAAGTGYQQSSVHRADGGAPGLGDYGRQGGAQPGAQPGLGGAGFGAGIHDTFTRGGYGAQGGQAFNAASTQPGDDMKPFGDGKTAGPSPAMGGARPGSATNPGPSQGGLPPPQSQQGMGAYAAATGFPGQLPSHGLHGAQSGTAGYGMGAGSAQGQQHTSYSTYGNTGFGSNNYYAQQQHPQQPQPQQHQQHQQRGGAGGWGTNYSGVGSY